MISENPYVAGFRARRDGNRWDVLVVGIILALHDHVDLTGREARDGEIKIDVHHGQVGQFKFEDLEIPAGVEGDLVVGQAQGTLLRIREAMKDDGRDFGHPDGFRCEQPSVTRYDRPIDVNQDRIGESELADRSHDLIDLTLGMSAGVPRIRPKAFHGSVRHGKRRR